MHTRTSNHERGFSLVEVLIALLVLSFGVLAALGLQVVATTNVQNANQRTIAVHLAHDLLERVRSNPSPAANQVYLSKTLDKEIGGSSFGTVSPVSCTQGSPCDADDLALNDLWQWEQMLDGYQQVESINGESVPQGGLVDPAACLSGPSAGGDGLYQIVIVWRSTSESANPWFNDHNIDTCANGLDRYGPGNIYRRVLSMTTFVTQ